MSEPLLSVSDLRGGYGRTRVLFGMNLEVGRGEIVTLLGRNGAGKTTTLLALMGLLPHRAGTVRLEGREIGGRKPEQIARAGLAYCPEDRGIYARLNVRENLELATQVRADASTTAEVFEFFPKLYARRASGGGQLSGGEQQMLAIGRTLRTGAPVILLDEPTEGLAPAVVESIATILRNIRDRGVAILLVEQNFQFAAALADRHYIMNNGAVAEHYRADELAPNENRVRALLGV